MAQSRGKGNYVINTFNGMAYGFFASLIIGTILKQLGTLVHVEQLVTWGTVAGYLMGPAIGIGMGYAIDAKGLNLISAVIAGAIGAGTFNNGVQAGNPISAYVAVLAAIEVTRLIQGKTPIDILLVPFVSICIAGLVTQFVGPYLTQMITWIGSVINDGVSLQPLFMSIVVGVLMGMALTAPISSAAIGIMLGLDGLAAGAALAGCCAQMIGFAMMSIEDNDIGDVIAIGIMLGLDGLAAGAALAGCCAQMIGFAMMSIEDNDIGDVIAIGIGTSMLQFKNIIRRPVIWLPTILTTIITAPISTVLLHIRCSAIGSGMGTAGLVGLLDAIQVMGNQYWIPLILIDVIAPAILTFSFYKAFRKLNYIRKGDLKIERL